MPANDQNDYVIVSTATAASDDAVRIARSVLEKGLGACIQYFPIRSVYKWNGAVEEAEEVLLLVKTRASLSDELISYIKSIHGYEVAEVIAFPIVNGSRAYLDWIDAETREGVASDE